MRILLSLGTAISILAVALLILFTPLWTHFALRVSGGGNDILATPQMAADVSDRTISEVLFGPGTFSFEGPPKLVGGVLVPAPFYDADEASHMRDVRVVLYGFLLLALASTAFLALALIRGSRDAARWKAVSRGGIWLITGLVVLGVFAFVAFDAVFTLFHEIFFPGGNWSFPPTSHLIQLYPEPFWELSAAALGILGGVGGIAIWFIARRRAAAVEPA